MNIMMRMMDVTVIVVRGTLTVMTTNLLLIVQISISAQRQTQLGINGNATTKLSHVKSD